MSQAPFWPVATDAMIADTTHLTAEETGAYMMLLMCLWRSNGIPLPLDHKKLCRMARVRPNRWLLIWENIEEFFDIENETITQNRLRKDWVTVQEKITRNRELGSLGGKAKSLKYKKPPLANATDSLVAKSYQPEPEPEPDSKKGISKDIPKNKGKSDERKCQLKAIFEPDSEIPPEYRKYAEDEGLNNIEATFEDWRDWWFSEGGSKVGAIGWKLTWQGRVRKDVKRQRDGSGNSNQSRWPAKPSITEAARLAINRHRAEQREI
jgi:uncharacterized protein YdaU (DUF1376 family)